MSRTSEFSVLGKLFTLRADDSFVKPEENPNYLPLLNNLIKFDIFQILSISKSKTWQDIFSNLNKFNFKFDVKIEDFSAILNDENAGDQLKVLYVFYYILNFKYLQKQIAADENEYKQMILGLITIRNFCRDQISTQIFSFFLLILIDLFNNDQCTSPECVTWIFDLLRSAFAIESADIFINFLNKAKTISEDFIHQSLSFIIDAYPKGKLPFPKEILIYLRPLCLEFNVAALKCLALIASPEYFTKDCNEVVLQIFRALSARLSDESGEVSIDSNQDEPVNHPKPSSQPFNYELIETESRFTNGFRNYIEFSNNQPEFLLSVLDKSARKIVQALYEPLIFFQSYYVQLLLDQIILHFKSSANIKQKYALYIIFILLCEKISKHSILSQYSSFFFNSVIFDQNITIFNTCKIDSILNEIRSLVFAIIESNGHIDIEEMIARISNPLFMAEFVSRIRNLDQYHNMCFLQTVINTSQVLQLMDIKDHSETIEKARSATFIVLCNLFIRMNESYRYFESIMRYCYEKNISSIFLNVYRQSLRGSRNYYDFKPCFAFISHSLKHNLNISWELIETTAKFFLNFKQSFEITHPIFTLLVRYLELNNDSKVALDYIIEFATYCPSLNSSQLLTICESIKKQDLAEYYPMFLTILGKTNLVKHGKEGFIIRNHLFLLILTFSYGFTHTILNLFNLLASYSLHNAADFHRAQIDHIIIQLLMNPKEKKITYYDKTINVKFECKSKAEQLMKTILFVNTDFSIVSLFLKNTILLPNFNELLIHFLNSPRKVLPIGNFDPALYSNKITGGFFRKSFTITFWLLSDDNCNNEHKNEINLLTFKSHENELRIILRQSRLIFSISEKRERDEVILHRNVSNNCNWALISIAGNLEQKLLITSINGTNPCRSQIMPLPFSESSALKLSVGGSSAAHLNHEICGYIGTITFHNKILDMTELDYAILSRGQIDRSDKSIVSSTLIFGDFNYIKQSYKHETVLSVISNPHTVSTILSLLNHTDNTEEDCYQYLCILDKIAYLYPIDVAPIYYFIKQESHYSYRKLYNIIYSIFTHIPKLKGDKTTDVLNHEWFKYIVVNLDIWIRYSNFQDILYFWMNHLIIECHDFFTGGLYFSIFLAQFEHLGKENILQGPLWEQFFIFLERVTYINTTPDEEKMLFSLIYTLLSLFHDKKLNSNNNFPRKIIKRQLIIDKNITSDSMDVNNITGKHSIPMSESVPVDLHRPIDDTQMINVEEHLELSSVSDEYFEIPTLHQKVHIPTLIEQTKTHKKVAPQSVKLPKTKNKQIPKLHNPTGFIEKPNLYDPSDDFDSVSEYKQVKRKLLCLLRLARFTKTAQRNRISRHSKSEFNANLNSNDLHHPKHLHKMAKHFSVLLQALRIRDPYIICEVLFTIHEVIPHQYVLEYTSKSLEMIDPSMYKDIIDSLRPTIQNYPYLFPLLSAIALFVMDDNFVFSNSFNQNKRRHSDIIISGKSVTKHSWDLYADDINFALQELVIPEYADKWSIFPMLLTFFLTSTDDKTIILRIIARSLQGKWTEMHKCILLISYLQDFFDVKDNDVLYGFLEELSNITKQKDILSNIFVNVALSYLFVPYIEDSKSHYYDSYNINKISDIINFVHHSNDTHLNAKFFVRIDDNHLFHEKRHELANKLINLSLVGSHSYSPDYIANLSKIVLGLKASTRICRIDEFTSNGKFIEKLKDDYKSQYIKQIRDILDHINESLTSKLFSEDENDKLLMKQSKNLLSDRTLSQKLELKESTIHGHKHKKTLDFCYRQGILLQLVPIVPITTFYQLTDNVNCHIIKNQLIPAYFQLKKDVVTIIWHSHEFKVDVKDFYGFKRETHTYEFFSTERKTFFIKFKGTESNKKLKKKMKKKKIYSKKKDEKMLDQYKGLWKEYNITTFELLMFLNTFSGKTINTKSLPFLPSVRSKYININKNDHFEIQLPDSIDFDFPKDFSEELADDNKRVYNEFLHKSIVSAEFYYLFESMAKTELIPTDIAKDRFEYLYKNRKILENIENIEDWVINLFMVQLPHRTFVNRHQTNSSNFTLPVKINMSYVAHIIDSECLYKFMIIANDGSIFLATQRDMKPIQSVKINLTNGVFFSSLIDGIVIYNNNSHKLLIIDKYGDHIFIPNIFIDPLYQQFSGSVSRLVYLTTPTRVNLCRDLAFDELKYDSKKKPTNKLIYESIYPFMSGLTSTQSSSSTAFDVKCQKFGNKEIHQVPSRVNILRTSLQFNLIVLASQDCFVRLCTLYEGKSINHFDLKGEEAVEILITASFGFIFIVTKSKLYLLSNNGTLIKETKYKGLDSNGFNEIKRWYAFTSKEGIDLIVTVGHDNVVHILEAFYIEKYEERTVIGTFRNLIDITFHASTDELIFLHSDGNIIRRMISTRTFIMNN